MSTVPYRLSEPDLPRLGLIVLQVDETIEDDFRQLFPPGTARLHITRVPSGDELTPGTIAGMETDLPAAAALLPPAARFDAVAYACTSGSALIGPARVRDLVQGATMAKHVTDPLTAALAACDALGLRRIGLVSPYTPPVAAPLVTAFEAHGVTVPETLSFGEEIEARVARIDPESIAEAVRSLADRSPLDGIFLSCTNLRTLGILDTLAAETGLPVLSSNQVLAWHMSRLSGLPPLSAPERLRHA